MDYHIIEKNVGKIEIENKMITRANKRENISLLNNKEFKMSKEKLINLFNKSNFNETPLILKCKHKIYDYVKSFELDPKPYSSNDMIQCTWRNKKSNENMSIFELIEICFSNENISLRLTLIPTKVDEEGIAFHFNEPVYYAYQQEKISIIKRIDAKLIQNGAIFIGKLYQCNEDVFLVGIDLIPPQTPQWINPEVSLTVVLEKNGNPILSGSAYVISKKAENNFLFCYLKLINLNIQRFKAKKFRSLRTKIYPLPIARIFNPFTEECFELETYDISGTGFSVKEGMKDICLPVGTILSNVEIRFADNYRISLNAQVVYRTIEKWKAEQENHKLAFAIIAIDLESHKNLLSILHRASDENLHFDEISSTKELWSFFFDSGFIYPEKYALIQKNKRDINQLYKTIYKKQNNIIRNFTYQKQGQIYGHMSILRFYNKSWMIQHHAAKKTSFQSGGIAVLNQIGRFINDSHRLYDAKMDYVFCYFRRDNKFPKRVFGGASNQINDKKACSIDSLGYIHGYAAKNNNALPNRWELVKSSRKNLEDLEAYYENNSGGLMLDALELKPKKYEIVDVTNAYYKIGLKRKRELFSLKQDSIVKAIIVVNITDEGLNLSNLTKHITVIVLDSNNLNENIFRAAVTFIQNSMNMINSPIMVYPLIFLENNQIPYERLYNLWILNMNNTDSYFRYLKRLLRFIQH